MKRRNRRQKKRQETTAIVPRKTESQSIEKSLNYFDVSIARQLYTLDQLRLKNNFQLDDPEHTKPLTNEDFISFGRDLLVRRAITKIAKGVARMPWIITPPEDADLEDPEVQNTLKKLKYSLSYPWIGGGTSTYFGYVLSVVTDFIHFGESVSEKIVQETENRLFWLVPQPYHLCYMNRRWKPHNSGLEPIAWCPHPDYLDNYKSNYPFYSYRESSQYQVIPFYFGEDIVVYNSDCTSFNIVPDSPLKRVYDFLILNEWHDLGRFRRKTVHDATKKEIIALLGDITDDQLDAFKLYWEQKYQQSQKQPIVAGDVKAVSLAGKNDAELYPQYTELLMRLIGLAFDLSPRDMNIQEHDNRATAGIAQSTTYNDATLPFALILEGVFNQQIVDPIAPGYRYKLPDLEPNSEKEESDRASGLYEKGLVTRNEARQLIGLEPTKDGDRFFDNQQSQQQELKK